MKMKPEDILKSVNILYQCRNRQELLIIEALFNTQWKPLLNNQEEGRDRILKIFLIHMFFKNHCSVCMEYIWCVYV